VPIYVGEFGALRWVPEAAAFLQDQTELFEQYGWGYAVYVWRGDEPDFDGFNLEYGPDPDSQTSDPGNPLLGLFRQRWAQNQHFPALATSGGGLPAGDIGGTSSTPRIGPLALADVRHWLYLIDVDLEPETVDQVVASTYDMVVLDFIPSEESNTRYPMADVVARLHRAPHPKLVIAYIDVGQAEDYRTYWQRGWEIGDPEWIVAGDPDGWEGNYPVAYWYDEYQNVWLGPDGYLQAILDAGFDGVYLDWIEAYSDEDVIALAEVQELDPVEEMIWWVGDIADFGRAQDPDFIVIGQNAAELAAQDDYVHIVDAIAQEQVWFDGGADNDPPGDCPLPRSEDDVDTAAYRNSLSKACRRQYDQYPEGTLHVSSEEYLRDLRLAQGRGLVIFTVDYALDADNIAWVYGTSRSLGFTPFVGSRALDRFVAPVP
jgi:cysteinyl-tRNA synthetase